MSPSWWTKGTSSAAPAARRRTRSSLPALLASLVLGGGVAVADTMAIVEGQGSHVPGADTDPCPPSTLYQNHDGSTESAFTWEGGGIEEPDYGALAEGYPGLTGGIVCGVELYLTR